MNNKLIIIIILALNALFMAGAAGLIYYSHVKESQRMTMQDIVRGVEKEKEDEELGATETEEEQELPMYELDTFTVNLADTAATRYARVTMKLELSNMDVENEIERRTPQIRDLIIILISSKRYADIQNPDGKNKLRDEIVKSINSYLVKGEVKNLYFTNFVVN